ESVRVRADNEADRDGGGRAEQEREREGDERQPDELRGEADRRGLREHDHALEVRERQRQAEADHDEPQYPRDDLGVDECGLLAQRVEYFHRFSPGFGARAQKLESARRELSVQDRKSTRLNSSHV